MGVRIAIVARVTAVIVLGALATLGLVVYLERPRPQPSTVPPDVSPSTTQIAREPDLETSSSSVQPEQPAPPPPPFYASLFVAGRTWDLPCRVRDQPTGTQRCHVDSVSVAPTQTSARIACWFVHDGETRDPDPAINTYVMTAEGLFVNSNDGIPLFTPHPVRKPLPKRWGQDPPNGVDAVRADAMIRHAGAWCSVHEVETWDTSFGGAECISERGIVGFSSHRDFIDDSCGDVP